MTRQLIDIKAGMRERLLMVALRLFAEKGIGAVSMREINLEAGSKNKSAVQYHFGSKEGVLEAIFEQINESLSPLYADLISRAEGLAKEEKLSTAEAMLTLYLPIIYTEYKQGFGPYMSKLLAKMMLDNEPFYQGLFQRLFAEPNQKIFKLLKKGMSKTEAMTLKFKLSHSFMATICGMATTDLMDKTLLGDVSFKSEQVMLMAYMDYLVGGLQSNDSAIQGIDANFWLQHFRELSESVALGNKT